MTSGGNLLREVGDFLWEAGDGHQFDGVAGGAGSFAEAIVEARFVAINHFGKVVEVEIIAQQGAEFMIMRACDHKAVAGQIIQRRAAGGDAFERVGASEDFVEHEPILPAALDDVVEHAEQFGGFEIKVALSRSNDVFALDQGSNAGGRENGFLREADAKRLGQYEIDGQGLDERGFPGHVRSGEEQGVAATFDTIAHGIPNKRMLNFQEENWLPAFISGTRTEGYSARTLEIPWSASNRATT
jgi:hypothetical protein